MKTKIAIIGAGPSGLAPAHSLLRRGVAEDYMPPYNRKMFGDDLNVLGTCWLDKLPSVPRRDGSVALGCAAW